MQMLMEEPTNGQMLSVTHALELCSAMSAQDSHHVA